MSSIEKKHVCGNNDIKLILLDVYTIIMTTTIGILGIMGLRNEKDGLFYSILVGITIGGYDFMYCYLLRKDLIRAGLICKRGNNNNNSNGGGGDTNVTVDTNVDTSSNVKQSDTNE